MDEFTSLLIADDTRVVVDLLKLSVCSRAGDRGRDVLSAVLSGMGTAYPQVSPGSAFSAAPVLFTRGVTEGEEQSFTTTCDSSPSDSSVQPRTSVYICF